MTYRAAAWTPWLLPLAGLPLALAGGELTLSAAGVLLGIGMGAALPNLLTRVQGLSAANQRAATASLVQLTRNLGGAVSVPLLGLWVTRGTPTVTGFVALAASLWLLTLAGLAISWRSR